MSQLVCLVHLMISPIFLNNTTSSQSVDGNGFGVCFEMGKNPAGCLLYIFHLSCLSVLELFFLYDTNDSTLTLTD